MEITDWGEEGMIKTVFKPLKSFKYDYIQQAEFLNEAAEQIKYNEEAKASGNLYTCEERTDGDETSPGYFMPILAAEIAEEGKKHTFDGGRCFQDISFKYDFNNDA